MPGPGYGLSLVLNIEQEEYGGITQAEGARWGLLQNVAWLNLKTFQYTRVVIHQRDEMPMVDDEGINVEPNTATDIAIEHVSDK